MRSYRRSLARDYLEALLIAILFAVFARTFLIQAFEIPTGSMEENLLVGDHILVNKFIYGSLTLPLEQRMLPQRGIQRGDVVVFRFPQDPARDFIKRCLGLPGDEIRIVDKVLHVNGQPLDESAYTFHKDETVYQSSRFLSPTYSRRDNFGPERVPADTYFCLGDNRDHSYDSRFWGNVPRKYVKGRAMLVYWSFGGPAPPQAHSVRGRIERFVHVMTRFFRHTRWERTFRPVR
jgi:signal peptidase I